MEIGGKDFDFDNRCYIMGILNVTPDSFSDGGRYTGVEEAVLHAKKMIREGASIIDVGGESTRPGHDPVDENLEINRVVPVIRELVRRIDVPISIDTSKAFVAEAAVEAGASLINDVWGFRRDHDIAEVASRTGTACCLMHNRENKDYHDLMEEITKDLITSVGVALEAGVLKEKIILDPGIGFGKDPVQNLIVMNNLSAIADLGYPWLLGASRKSMIGAALDLDVDNRLEGTLVTTVLAVLNGASIVRVHDVKENYRALRMTEAIIKSGKNDA